MKKFLHVGCGSKSKEKLKGFCTDDWEEIRFDIDQTVNPDIVGTLTDMSSIPTKAFDMVYSAHSIEHLFAHEVLPTLKEFHRVLKDDGLTLLTCPDLQVVCEAVAKDKLLEPLYQSSRGPISPIDILYGHRNSLANGNQYMAHKCGFTSTVLDEVFAEAGFKSRARLQSKKTFDLWILASKSQRDEGELKALALNFFP